MTLQEIIRGLGNVGLINISAMIVYYEDRLTEEDILRVRRHHEKSNPHTGNKFLSDLHYARCLQYVCDHKEGLIRKKSLVTQSAL